MLCVVVYMYKNVNIRYCLFLCFSAVTNHCYNLFDLFWQGIHGVEDDVFLSVPSVLGRHGIDRMVVQSLSDSERAMVQKSAKTLHEVQESIKF